MTVAEQPSGPASAATFRWALIVAGGFFAFVAWDQSAWWRVKEDYSFGWLVPLFAAFVVRDRWPKISAALTACGADGSRRVVGGQAWVLRFVVSSALLLGALVFMLGSVYRAGNGTSQPGTLALTCGTVLIMLPLLFLHAPQSRAPAPGGMLGDARVKLVGLFVFPVLVWLISAPLVSAVELQLNRALMRIIVTTVAAVFDVLGLPIEQHGNVLSLPTGSVGVEEACSGIRSLTGCLFAGSFLAAVFVDRLWKKIALVSTALVLALITNLGRSLFLTAWAYRHGPKAIEGTVHDAAGYAVLGLTVTGLLCLLPLINLKFSREPE